MPVIAGYDVCFPDGTTPYPTQLDFCNAMLQAIDASQVG